jgi:hypothetical protein
LKDPDTTMARYLTDQIVGKPKERVEVSGTAGGVMPTVIKSGRGQACGLMAALVSDRVFTPQSVVLLERSAAMTRRIVLLTCDIFRLRTV